MNKIPENYYFIEKIEFNEKYYIKATNIENGNKVIFDSENNVCFGGEHIKIGDFKIIDNIMYLEAWHEQNSNIAYYNFDGKACFGGEHAWNVKFISVDNVTYLLAQHEKNGTMALYDMDGKTWFGGEHWIIIDFVVVDDIIYLKTLHEKNGDEVLYDKDGKVKIIPTFLKFIDYNGKILFRENEFDFEHNKLINTNITLNEIDKNSNIKKRVVEWI